MGDTKKRKRNANTNRDDYMDYLRSIELLAKMKTNGAINQSEYNYLKGCFMRDYQVSSDFMLGRKINDSDNVM